MIRWLYNLAFPLVFLALLPGFLRRMVRRGHYRLDFWQRFGFYRAEVLARLAAGPRGRGCKRLASGKCSWP